MKRLNLTKSDRWIFLGGTMILLIFAVFFSRANLVADSVDYYAILQWITPADEKPIVDNLHFAEQRSPGYSLVALIPYGLLSLYVEPFISTEKVVETESGLNGIPTGPPPHGSADERAGHPPSGPSNSPPMLIPPQPLLLIQVPFKDYYNSHHGSWYQWKLAMSLAVTSFGMLFLGIASCVWMLRWQHAEFPGYSLVILAIFTSPIFISNVIVTPLYATLTAFGASSLFVYFFMKGWITRKAEDLLLSGLFLGILVLTRLETCVIAGTVVMALLIKRDFRTALLLLFGSCLALLAWMGFNWTVHGTILHFGILRGDINRLVFNLRYILECLIHPASGVLIWTPFLAPGIAFLLWSCSFRSRILGYASVIFLALLVIRVPVMYFHIGEIPLDIGGIPVGVPPTSAEMRSLIRSDMNRYVIVLIPFLILGLREGIERFHRRVGGNGLSTVHLRINYSSSVK